MAESERDQRLADWLEGNAGEEQAAALLAELQTDEAFRQDAARTLVLRRHLDQKSIPEGDFTSQVLDTLRSDKSASLTSGVITDIKHHQQRQRTFLRAAAGLAAAALLALGCFIAFAPSHNAPTVRVLATEGVSTLKMERLLSGQRIRLGRGILELDLADKARVVIEAPAAFNLRSPEHLYLNRGKIFAEMTEGESGLLIETPKGNVLDLGTKFAVDVNSPEELAVHVFDGEVDVALEEKTTRLAEGEALVLDLEGAQNSVPAQPDFFVSTVPGGARADTAYLHWSFDEGRGDITEAKGNDGGLGLARGNLLPTPSASTPPRWIDGVFGQALDFDGAGQWVETYHPGIAGNRDRTFAAWIKIPSDWSGQDKAPIVSWGLVHSKKETGRGWMLTLAQGGRNKPEIAGRLRLSLGEQFVVGTTDLRDGRWHHVAAVVIGGEVRSAALLYIDGNLENVNRDTIESMETETGSGESKTVRFGRQIFWDDQYLRGALDEAYLFDAALSGDQIRSLMNGEVPRPAPNEE